MGNPLMKMIDINQWVFEDEPEDDQDDSSNTEEVEEDQLQDDIDFSAEPDFEPNPLKHRVNELKKLKFQQPLYQKERNELRKLQKVIRPNIVCVSMSNTPQGC